jgi:hypothetical protein
MGFGASARLTQRKVLRGTPTSMLLLVLIIGVASGTAMAAAAGGRRAATSFDRLLVWSRASDVNAAHVDSFGWQETPDPNAPELLTKLAVLPEVAESAVWNELRGRAVLRDGTELVFPGDQLHVVAPAGAMRGVELDRPKVLRGRLPRDDAIAEVAIPLATTAQPLHLDVADSVELVLQDASGQVLHDGSVRVSGVVVTPDGLPSMSGRVLVPTFLASPALAEANPASVQPGWQSLSIRLRNDVDVDDLRTALDAADLNDLHLYGFEEGYRSGVRHLVRLEAYALWLASAIVIVLGIVLATQLQLRAAQGAGPGLVTLRALGMQPRDMARAGAWGGAMVGLGSAALGVALASPPRHSSQ